MKKISIVIPAYNEEKTVRKILEKVLAVKLSLEKEIIIVNDGSIDRTKEIIEELIKYHPNENIKFISKKKVGKEVH